MRQLEADTDVVIGEVLRDLLRVSDRMSGLQAQIDGHDTCIQALLPLMQIDGAYCGLADVVRVSFAQRTFWGRLRLILLGR